MTDGNSQVIDIVERLHYNLGTAIQCIVSAGRLPGSPHAIPDLEAAKCCLEREIKRIKQDAAQPSQSSAIRRDAQVDQLAAGQQDGSTWRDRMGDKYRYVNGAWEYQTIGLNNWEPVRFREILTNYGPYTPDCYGH